MAPNEIANEGKLPEAFEYLLLFRNVLSIVNPFVTVYLVTPSP